eukprot:GFUD01039962.1.p1 GENE.GFUD01039962.1~~GFUD01039962.1.p1  ORF type:complete len:259 (-),score=45.19 GFUD01039962.1:157-933(-)
MCFQFVVVLLLFSSVTVKAKPTVKLYATEAPTTEAPTTKAPTTEAPTTEASTEAPTTEAPTEAPTTEAPPQDGSYAYATVELLAGGDSGVSGTLLLIQGQAHVYIVGRIFGLNPGLHGFHVHAIGATGNNCNAAGGHFNPDNSQHGAPWAFSHLAADLAETHPHLQNANWGSSSRHAGDLGNIMVHQDSPHGTSVDIVDEVITLGDGGLRDVAGRAIVVHAGQDDLGRGIGDEAEGSKKTGNAGARVACGVIKLREYD